MADAPQGLASFPGVQQVVSWMVNLHHGVRPSVFRLVTAPQDGFVGAGGTFSINYDSTTISFSNCKIDQATYEVSPQGQTWTLSIFDRRWRWSGLGTISGSYNRKNDDGSLTTDAILQTPQQLMSLVLNALNESDYDVSDVPNTTNPSVEWDGARPDAVLSYLCDQLGCRVVLQLDDTIKICLVGNGADLPIDDTVISNSLTIDPPDARTPRRFSAAHSLSGGFAAGACRTGNRWHRAADR